jgi:hypothetical protein
VCLNNKKNYDWNDKDNDDDDDDDDDDGGDISLRFF